MQLTDNNLKKRPIIGSDGRKIGEIDGFVVDSEDLRIVSVKAKLLDDIADQLGARRSIFRSGTLDIPVGLIHGTADTVILTVPVNELRNSIAELQHH